MNRFRLRVTKCFKLSVNNTAFVNLLNVCQEMVFMRGLEEVQSVTKADEHFGLKVQIFICKQAHF